MPQTANPVKIEWKLRMLYITIQFAMLLRILLAFQNLPEVYYLFKMATKEVIFDFLIAAFSYFGPDARKPVFGGLRETKAQTGLRIRAD